jgi:hypothetical protein
LRGSIDLAALVGLQPSPPNRVRMPKIATVDGLVVKLFFKIAGKLPRAKLPNLTSWWEEHRDALKGDWQRAQLGLHPIGRYHSS